LSKHDLEQEQLHLFTIALYGEKVQHKSSQTAGLASSNNTDSIAKGR